MIPTPAALRISGPDISYKGIHFTADPVLGDEVFMRAAPESPLYTEFSFAPAGVCQQIGCVTVYRVEEFRKYPFGDAIMDALQAAIETGSTSYFPTWGAGILLRAQTQHVRFQNGIGIRAIVERAQIGVFANNEALMYDFHGLTEDGQYYVRVIYPIDAPILLSSSNPAENTNKGAIPVPDLPDDDPFGILLKQIVLEYNREVQRQLEPLAGSSFIPDLEILDEFAESLWITSAPGK